MHYNISIIIVNYNGLRYIDQLFQSFESLRAEHFNFEIIFVDNHSSDDSITYLKENYAHNSLKIVESDKNLGFAGGNNLGVQHASGDYIVFLNNDTKVDPEWLSNLYTCMVEERAGIVTSKLLFFYDFIKIGVHTNDKLIIDNEVILNNKTYKLDPKFCKNMLVYEDHSVCFGHSYFYLPLLDGNDSYDILIKKKDPETNGNLFTDNGLEYEPGNVIHLSASEAVHSSIRLIQNVGSGIDQGFNGYDIGFCEEDTGQYEQIREVETTCGAAMMMKKDDFISAGMFDEVFFMYYEDTDLAFRIKKMGKRLIYCPSAVVRHIHTGSSKEWSPFFIFHVYRNRMLFILKNFPKSVFVKEYIRFIASILKSAVSNEQREVKEAKWNSLRSLRQNMARYKKMASKGRV
ncbi:glycosyltransferase family 2 protein [Paenibacillus chitinolyticus]|uniref:glycosyltransferase family 2 protein n=1 Tax=Paenibacillus chitinolyticus TaxID=79263 RepID=UPI003633C29A